MLFNYANPYKFEAIVKKYIKDIISTKYNLDPNLCKIVKPIAGVKSIVRLIEIPDSEGIVVKAYFGSKRKEGQVYKEAIKLLEEIDVNAPRLINYAEKYSSYGMDLLTEEFIPGSNFLKNEITEDLIEPLAEEMAKMHKKKSSRWGIIADTKSAGSFYSNWYKRMKNRLNGVKEAYWQNVSSTPDTEYLSVIKRFFKRWKSVFEYETSFDLIHDKINPGNIMVGEDGKIYILDLQTLQFGNKAKDLIPLYHEILKSNKNYIEKFNKRYYEIMGERERESYNRMRDFFHAYYHLAECAINAKRSIKRYENSSMGDKEIANQKALDHWDKLMKIIEG